MSIEDEILGSAVEPSEEKMVQFYEDRIPVVRLLDGRLYVPVNPIAEALGISSRAQRLRVMRDDVMASDAEAVLAEAPDGKRRSMLAIPLQQLPGFLFGVTTGKANPEVREKLIRYKREAFDVLWRAFAGEPDTLLPLPTAAGLSRAEETLQQIEAMREMALQQVEIERRLAGVENKQQVMGQYVRKFIEDTRVELADHSHRLGDVERGLATDDPISEAQAAEITLAVKLLALLIEQHSGKRAYGMVYDTLYHRFGIRSYYKLPRKQYEAAIAWLRDWYEQEQARQQEGASA